MATDTSKPVWVIDMDILDPNVQYLPLATFDTLTEAEEWIGRQDPNKVERGGYGIDAPEELLP